MTEIALARTPGSSADTVAWTPVAGAAGYRFTVEGKVSHTFDAARASVRVAKGKPVKVEALGVLASGIDDPASPPPPPPPTGIQAPIGPFTVLDGKNARADFAEQAYIHTGSNVTIQNLHVLNCTDRGIGAMQWQPPNPNTIPGITKIRNCKVEHVTRNPPKTSNGTAEACYWLGNPFDVDVIEGTDGGWMIVWTGNRAIMTQANPSLLKNFKLHGGPVVGKYHEHDTAWVVCSKGLINVVGGTDEVYEWWYAGEYGGGTMHGSHDIVNDGIEYFEPIFLDAGTYGVKYRNCIFHGDVRFPTKLMDPVDHNVNTANRNLTNVTHPNPNVVENTCVFKDGATLKYHSNNLGWGGQGFAKLSLYGGDRETSLDRMLTTEFFEA